MYTLLGGAWVALLESGVDPVIVGLAMGLPAMAYPAARGELEHATRPVQAVPRAADRGARALRARERADRVSPNERLQQLYHPASYVIVPLFALAERGDRAQRDTSWRRRTPRRSRSGSSSRYVVGKPMGSSARPGWSPGSAGVGVRLPVGWASLAGGGAIAGIGFTVSLLIASLAFNGDRAAEAKLGVLTAALAPPL